MPFEKLVVKPEWRDLLPPLKAEERAELEKSILAEGCREAIIKFGSIIVDGNNRYEICVEHGLPYETVPFYGGADFDYLTMRQKEEAIKRWIITTQLGRRNLTDEQRTHYVGMLYESQKADPVQNLKKGNEEDNLRSGGTAPYEAHNLENEGSTPSSAIKSDETSARLVRDENRVFDTIRPKLQNATSGKSEDTATRIAREHGVSRDTVIRAGQYAKGIEAIGKISPEAKAKILSGESKKIVTQEHIRKIAIPGSKPDDKVKAVVSAVLDNKPLGREAAPVKPPEKVAPVEEGGVWGEAMMLAEYITRDIDALDRLIAKIESPRWDNLGVLVQKALLFMREGTDAVFARITGAPGATGGKGECGLPGTEVAAPSSVSSPAIPIVPAAERPEAVSFFGDDFLSGTVNMTLEQRGAYITLLSMELSKGPLTKDEMLTVTKDKLVHSKFQITDNDRYINPRMEKEVGKRAAHQSAQRERANARWITKNGNGKGGAECPGNAAALPVLKDLKDKTKQEKHKDVSLATPPLNKNGVNVLSVDVDVNETTEVDTEGAGGGGRETVVRDPEFDQGSAADEAFDEAAMTTAPKATKEPRKQRGPDGWVKLTDTEYNKLVEKYGAEKVTDYIKRIDLYCAGNGNAKRYKSFYHVILNWIGRDAENGTGPFKNKPLTGGRTVYEFDRVAIESGKYDNLEYDN